MSVCNVTHWLADTALAKSFDAVNLIGSSNNSFKLHESNTPYVINSTCVRPPRVHQMRCTWLLQVHVDNKHSCLREDCILSSHANDPDDGLHIPLNTRGLPISLAICVKSSRPCATSCNAFPMTACFFGLLGSDGVLGATASSKTCGCHCMITFAMRGCRCL